MQGYLGYLRNVYFATLSIARLAMMNAKKNEIMLPVLLQYHKNLYILFLTTIPFVLVTW
jgi:hypothetical protein